MRQGLVIMGERQIQRKYYLWDVEFVLHALAHALPPIDHAEQRADVSSISDKYQLYVWHRVGYSRFVLVRRLMEIIRCVLCKILFSAKL